MRNIEVKSSSIWSNTAKDQMVTLEVNIFFTLCLSFIQGSKENTEDVCAGSALQTLSIHSISEHLQQSLNIAVEKQRLCADMQGWKSSSITSEDEGKWGE